MKKRGLMLLLVAVAAVLLSGCVTWGVVGGGYPGPGRGYGYYDECPHSGFDPNFWRAFGGGDYHHRHYHR